MYATHVHAIAFSPMRRCDSATRRRFARRPHRRFARPDLTLRRFAATGLTVDGPGITVRPMLRRPSPRLLRIASWNVNGLRACAGKGHFLPFLRDAGAEILGVQEVRARPEQLGPDLAAPGRWHTHFVAAERPGYSGVGLFSRRSPDLVETSLAAPHLDIEGRAQLAHFGPLVVANIYFPNGNGLERDNSRVPYKLEFYRRLFTRLSELRAAGKRVLVLGDFNTAHAEHDLARPRENRNTSGFLLEEREELGRWLAAGWVDTFRMFHAGPGHYSWWSQRSGARERNIGWRIDYVLACPAAAAFVREAKIHREVQGSDHCPVSVRVDPAILDLTIASTAPARPPSPTPTAPVAGIIVPEVSSPDLASLTVPAAPALPLAAPARARAKTG